MKIILGISGGISAYKTPDLVRKLVKAGHEVQVIMTYSAHNFVAPMALRSVSGRSIREKLFDPEAESAMDHIELARWAEKVLIAPATAHCIAQLSYGLASDLLTTLCLATTAPITLAPAMNHKMWLHEATQENIAKLQARGVALIGPSEGEQACGETGFGRMVEPELIIKALFKDKTITC